MTKRHDWNPPIRSLLKIAKNYGMICIAVDNGEGWEKVSTIKEAVMLASACDDASLKFETKDGTRANCYIVLGNEPEELVSDYTIHPLLDIISGEHSLKWQGIKCPVVYK